MQVTLFQRINNDLLIFMKDVKEEVEPELYPRLKKVIEKEYPIFSTYEIKKVYMTDDYKFIIQLYDEKSNDYRVIEL